MKSFRPQLHRYIPIPLTSEEKLFRVNYEELLDQLHFPVIWVYEHYLQAWLPSEVDHNFLNSIDKGFAHPLLLAASNLVEENKMYWEVLHDSFSKDGYVIMPQLLSEEYAKRQVASHYRRQLHLQNRYTELTGIHRSSINNLPWMRLLHQASEKLVNFIVAPQKIKTSYSFASEYDRFSSLPRHTDRSQCVYNISLMLGSSPFGADLTQWPLYIERNGVTIEVALNPGDGVLYLGRRDPHWRNQMPPNLETALGVFFHYVEKDFTGSLD